MTSETIIRAEGLWKRYGLPLRPFLRQQLDWLRGRFDSAPEAYGPWALKDLNFEVQRGETLGIIGRNGAGKSTLLKILAGVTRPTRGHVTAPVRIFPMIELTAGMHQELSGYENIHLLAAIMGLSRKEIRANLPAIAEFSELGEWLERPVRMYSSGMLVRLGFAVAVNVNADLLLVDEVLAVGDIAFRAKCYDYIRTLQQNGTTVLFVSHSTREVQRICSRTILMHQGRIIASDRTDKVIAEYLRMGEDKILAQMLARTPDAIPVISGNTGQIRAAGIAFLDNEGIELDEPVYNQPLTLRLFMEVLKPIDFPQIEIGFQSPEGTDFAFMRYTPPEDAARLLPGSTYIDCHLEKLPLLPGNYSLWVTMDAAHGMYKMEQVQNIRQFYVAPNHIDRMINNYSGFSQFAATWQWQETIERSLSER